MQNKNINRFVIEARFFVLREMPNGLLNVLNINNLKFWCYLGFRASDLGFSLGGVSARNPPTLKLRRIPRSLGEGGNFVEVVLLNFLSVRI